MHDLETYANVDAHSANPPLVRCFHHTVGLQILSLHPRNHMLGKIQRDGLWQHHKFGLLLPAHILHDCNAS